MPVVGVFIDETIGLNGVPFYENNQNTKSYDRKAPRFDPSTRKQIFSPIDQAVQKTRGGKLQGFVQKLDFENNAKELHCLIL
jgi:hypothetical protein